MAENNINKNANNKVDELYNIWLEKRDSNSFAAKKTTAQSVVFSIISWLELKSLFQTFETVDFEGIAADLQKIYELLDEDD